MASGIENEDVLRHIQYMQQSFAAMQHSLQTQKQTLNSIARVPSVSPSRQRGASSKPVPLRRETIPSRSTVQHPSATVAAKRNQKPAASPHQKSVTTSQRAASCALPANGSVANVNTSVHANERAQPQQTENKARETSPSKAALVGAMTQQVRSLQEELQRVQRVLAAERKDRDKKIELEVKQREKELKKVTNGQRKSLEEHAYEQAIHRQHIEAMKHDEHVRGMLLIRDKMLQQERNEKEQLQEELAKRMARHQKLPSLGTDTVDSVGTSAEIGDVPSQYVNSFQYDDFEQQLMHTDLSAHLRRKQPQHHSEASRSQAKSAPRLPPLREEKPFASELPTASSPRSPGPSSAPERPLQLSSSRRISSMQDDDVVELAEVPKRRKAPLDMGPRAPQPARTQSPVVHTPPNLRRTTSIVTQVQALLRHHFSCKVIDALRPQLQFITEKSVAQLQQHIASMLVTRVRRRDNAVSAVQLWVRRRFSVRFVSLQRVIYLFRAFRMLKVFFLVKRSNEMVRKRRFRPAILRSLRGAAVAIAWVCKVRRKVLLAQMQRDGKLHNPDGTDPLHRCTPFAQLSLLPNISKPSRNTLIGMLCEACLCMYSPKVQNRLKAIARDHTRELLFVQQRLRFLHFERCLRPAALVPFGCARCAPILEMFRRRVHYFMQSISKASATLATFKQDDCTARAMRYVPPSSDSYAHCHFPQASRSARHGIVCYRCQQLCQAYALYALHGVALRAKVHALLTKQHTQAAATINSFLGQTDPVLREGQYLYDRIAWIRWCKAHPRKAVTCCDSTAEGFERAVAECKTSLGRAAGKLAAFHFCEKCLFRPAKALMSWTVGRLAAKAAVKRWSFFCLLRRRRRAAAQTLESLPPVPLSKKCVEGISTEECKKSIELLLASKNEFELVSARVFRCSSAACLQETGMLRDVLGRLGSCSFAFKCTQRGAAVNAESCRTVSLEPRQPESSTLCLWTRCGQVMLSVVGRSSLLMPSRRCFGIFLPKKCTKCLVTGPSAKASSLPRASAASVVLSCWKCPQTTSLTAEGKGGLLRRRGEAMGLAAARKCGPAYAPPEPRVCRVMTVLPCAGVFNPKKCAQRNAPLLEAGRTENIIALPPIEAGFHLASWKNHEALPSDAQRCTELISSRRVPLSVQLRCKELAPREAKKHDKLIIMPSSGRGDSRCSFQWKCFRKVTAVFESGKSLVAYRKAEAPSEVEEFGISRIRGHDICFFGVFVMHFECDRCFSFGELLAQQQARKVDFSGKAVSHYLTAMCSTCKTQTATTLVRIRRVIRALNCIIFRFRWIQFRHRALQEKAARLGIPVTRLHSLGTAAKGVCARCQPFLELSEQQALRFGDVAQEKWSACRTAKDAETVRAELIVLEKQLVDRVFRMAFFLCLRCKPSAKALLRQAHQKLQAVLESRKGH